MQRCRCRCRDAEVQRYYRIFDVQRSRGEVQRCRGAEVQRFRGEDVDVDVERCRGAGTTSSDL